jgi:threonine aldolase
MYTHATQSPHATNNVVDFRSDTVTRPSPGMYAAMMAAPVGDDVWGDDPTVIRLQAMVAEIAGKEAGLFLPTGTQSNLAALMAHCERGDEYIVGQNAHTYRWEGGGAAVLGSIQPQPIEHEADGTLPLAKIEAAIKPFGTGLGTHFARSRLLTLENTHGGKVLPQSYIEAACALAKSKGLATHWDGARAFNAAIAQKQPLATLAKPFDSVSLCFSKGLGAPVGSVLVGSHELIEKAARWRKVLGGGMRQAGVLAAACIYALEHNVKRLSDDHALAQSFAEELSHVSQLKVTGSATNMVFIDVPAAHCVGLQKALTVENILIGVAPSTRLVTHLDVNPNSVERAAQVMQRYFAKAPS